ncbi:MAG: hypothetical protein ACK56I_02370, partial [bacterium]
LRQYDHCLLDQRSRAARHAQIDCLVDRASDRLHVDRTLLARQLRDFRLALCHLTDKDCRLCELPRVFTRARRLCMCHRLADRLHINRVAHEALVHLQKCVTSQ